jgi:hypothetical protein
MKGETAMPLSIKVRSDTMDAIQAPVPAGYHSVIKNVTAQNVSNLFGNQKSHVVPDAQGWRIDRQNPTSDGSNAQVQRNGVKDKSTIACVVLPARYNVAMPATTPATKAKLEAEHNARMSELAKVVRHALTQSVQSYQAGPQGKPGHVTGYQIVGEFSAKLK